MDVPLWAWAAVLGVILAMLAIDLFAHRRAHVIGVREALGWSIFCGPRREFRCPDRRGHGAEFSAQYFAGYVIEKSWPSTTCLSGPSSSAISRSP